MAGVAIALQAACDCGAVNEPSLQRLAAAADLRVRRVTAAAADLIVTRGGQTAAFLLWRGAAADAAARTARAAGSFKSVFVLVPYDLAADQAVLDAAASAGCEEAQVSFVFMPLGGDFAERALALSGALLPAEAEVAAWRQQQAAAVESGEAVTQVLLGLPLPADVPEDALHQAAMLRMLGSLQEISQRRPEEITALTDLDSCTAAAVAAFFQRGGRTAHGLPGFGAAQLQSL
ncbi:hydantoinase subunit beta [Chlorella sorokiniana]|uniref:Hydantoinase subunit beta n=1 Tax=Chlorella sorokiniana TaxID=3076 RepID=A0A2P6TKH1_CHLSO|nr:hydantoinase subunit beta [Chlorella sorokiniana]|eukprot:PRW44579.1 hydantoinase subunit beta [Chlorella sorokiniana]